VPENGREIDGLDDKSELAHRIMLVNLLRLLSAVKTKKASRHFVTRPTQVILPLSPNHGLFGNDGLYSESKISLETLFNRWNSESWGEYLCLAGAVIGWTHVTGPMDATNSVAQQAELRRAITQDNSADFIITNGVEAERVLQTVKVNPHANFKFDFPHLESQSSLVDVSQLRGMVDLKKVIVITGFAEVSPWGSSRTRWEMECRGQFTIECCIEMAWIMGHIKHFDGRLPDGTLHVGWVDTKTGQPVDDKEICGKYEKDILTHTGVRLIEPEIFHGYDPKKKSFNQEIELIHDLEPLEVAEEARTWWSMVRKGARVYVPKAFSFSRLVAGQIPTGWDAGRYGIPADIIAQVDRAPLWAFVAAAEPLNAPGITDPYELYKYMHPSEVGTCIGSGMGSMESRRKMFRDRREEKDVQNDILQETFINTTAGWIDLLLMSSSGPIKTPVGACATALQSVEIACDTIIPGKAKVMLTGGYDDVSEEGSYEFSGTASSNWCDRFSMADALSAGLQSFVLWSESLPKDSSFVLVANDPRPEIVATVDDTSFHTATKHDQTNLLNLTTMSNTPQQGLVRNFGEKFQYD
ncbi:thiolase-like protein, partial [Rickenella mellea]